jgi:hypothetical protein
MTGELMDPIGWYIASMHKLLGHDRAAAAMGVPAGSKRDCRLCQYERNPSPAARDAVVRALATQEGP